jgi:hypothetical protein
MDEREHALRAAKQELVKRFLLAPPGTVGTFAALGRVVPAATPRGNVVGVGISDKIVGRQLVGELCVKIYVRQKLPEAELDRGALLPRTVDGVPTDVEEVGRIRALQPSCTVDRRRRVSPAPCGVSVGHRDITAGTIGALARDSGAADNGRRYILSNNHVLANSNAGAVGDDVFQPGPLDGGTPAQHRIGRLHRFVRLELAGGENVADAAIAEVAPGAVLAEICSLGAIGPTVPARRNATVFKHGRTTGLTRGVVTDVDADIRVDYAEAGVGVFADQVVVRGLPPTSPFSQGGDSGSLIVDAERRPCALLFAGADGADVTFANPIRAVTRRLRIRLL